MDYCNKNVRGKPISIKGCETLISAAGIALIFGALISRWEFRGVFGYASKQIRSLPGY